MDATRKCHLRKKAEAFLKEALDAVEQNRIQKAKRLFERALTIDPDFLEAQKGLASIDRTLLRRSLRETLKSASEAFNSQQFEKAEQLLATVIEIDPQNIAARKKLSACQMLAKKWDECLASCQFVLAAEPHDVASWRRIIEALAASNKSTELVSTLSQLAEVAKGHQRLSLGVLAPALARQGREREAFDLYSNYSPNEYDERNWSFYINTLAKFGRSTAIVKAFESGAFGLTTSPRRTANILKALFDEKRHEQLGLAVEDIRASCPTDFQLEALAELPAIALDETTRLALVETAIKSDWSSNGAHFRHLADKIPDELEGDLLASLECMPKPFQITFWASWLRSRQLKAADRASLGIVTWDHLVNDSQKADAKIKEICATSEDEFLKLPLVVEKTANARGLASSLNQTDLVGTTRVAKWICDRIQARVPTSIIRVGDGEGSFLPYDEEAQPFEASDRAQIQTIWWPLQDHADGAATRELCDLFAVALENADAVGLPAVARTAAEYLQEKDERRVRGLRAALLQGQQLLEKQTNCSLIFSCNAHHELENWNLISEFLRVAGEVSVVSCHDLAPYLLERYSVRTKWSFRTPPEARWADRMGYDTATATKLFPDGFNEFKSGAPIEPGDVYLIAAGFVGKLMCDYIKGRGGIAIDLGSIVDHWIGHQTRGNFLYFEVDFSLAASLVQGHPLPQLAPPERSSAPFQSDGQRQVNLYPQLRGYSDGKLPEQVSTQVGLIGHPRCGSGYAAVALQMRGLDIGHEFLDQDGMVSWLAAVEDFSSPSGAATAGLTFECLGAYHRDPYEAVPSIVLENGKASSFLFRRFHIFNHFGVDLLQFQDPLDRAVASLVYWMRIVDQRRPVFNIRVEHFDQDLERVKMILPANIQNALKDSVDIARIGYNSSSGKFLVSKPTYKVEDYTSLDPILRRMLGELCELGGYSRAFLGRHP